MKNLITTYCNQYKGDFLIHHWLKSLQLHVDLRNVDIMVIDFGLTDLQKNILIEKGIIVNRQVAEGRMSNIQYAHLSSFLKAHPDYDQVLYCDCGDIIFQKDISILFQNNKSKFKAVIEPDFNFYLHKITLGLGDIKKEAIPDIRKVLGNNPTVNGGFLIGPASKMAAIWDTYSSLCNGTERHGTDQIIINYILYSEGFERLPGYYNHIAFLNRDKFILSPDRFYLGQEGVIPVVHNAGRYDFARRITNFGYRTGHIRPLFFTYLFRYYYKLLYGISRIS